MPYEGVSRMQTSLRRRHRDRVVRRGLALIIESDFVRPGPRIDAPGSYSLAHPLDARVCPAQYATDAGRQHFADQLTSIRYCVQEVCTLAPACLNPFALTLTCSTTFCVRRPATLTRSTLT